MIETNRLPLHLACCIISTLFFIAAGYGLGRFGNDDYKENMKTVKLLAIGALIYIGMFI